MKPEHILTHFMVWFVGLHLFASMKMNQFRRIPGLTAHTQVSMVTTWYGQYDLVGSRASSIEARLLCAVKGGHLAEFRKMAEVKPLIAVAKAVRGYWVGAVRRNAVSRWIWHGSNILLSSTFNNSIVKSPGSEEVTGSSSANCLALVYDVSGKSLQFMESNCSDKKPYICQRVISDINTIPVKSWRNNATKFSLYASKVPWNTALRFCNDLGASLAEIRDSFLAKTLGDIMRRSRPKIVHAWIGGRKLDGNVWTWIGGGDVDWKEIPKNHSRQKMMDRKEDCLSANGLDPSEIVFEKRQCDKRYAFVCSSVVDGS